MRRSQNLPLPPRLSPPPFQTIYMCDSPRIYPSLPEYTPLFKNYRPMLRIYPSGLLPQYTPIFNKCILCATLPESTPPSQNIPPFSATVCDPPKIYPSLPKYTLIFNKYIIMPPCQNLPLPSGIYPLFNQFICATLPESTPPGSSHNIPPFEFQQMYMCDPPRIYPSLPESTPF